MTREIIIIIKNLSVESNGSRTLGGWLGTSANQEVLDEYTGYL